MLSRNPKSTFHLGLYRLEKQRVHGPFMPWPLSVGIPSAEDMRILPRFNSHALRSPQVKSACRTILFCFKSQTWTLIIHHNKHGFIGLYVLNRMGQTKAAIAKPVLNVVMSVTSLSSCLALLPDFNVIKVHVVGTIIFWIYVQVFKNILMAMDLTIPIDHSRYFTR